MHSLSLALQYYPQLAGKLRWHPDTGKPVIRVAPDEDGVFLTVAESTVDFHSLYTHDAKEVSVLHSLLSDLPVSSFTAVCSYVWTCLCKAEEEDISSENVLLGIAMDCRSRLEPPIPANYIGNCIAIRIATEKVVSLELVTAARAIKDAVGSLPKGVVEGAEKWFSDIYSEILASQKLYSIGGSPLFELYGADFGWGRPMKVEMVSIDKTGAFSLCDARDHENGGMEIRIVLSKPKMEAFASIFANGLLQEIAN